MDPFTGKIKKEGKTYQQLKEFVKKIELRRLWQITKKLTEVSKRNKSYLLLNITKSIKKDPDLFLNRS
jgi:hypothetical protein